MLLTPGGGHTIWVVPSGELRGPTADELGALGEVVGPSAVADVGVW